VGCGFRRDGDRIDADLVDAEFGSIDASLGVEPEVGPTQAWASLGSDQRNLPMHQQVGPGSGVSSPLDGLFAPDLEVLKAISK